MGPVLKHFKVSKYYDQDCGSTSENLLNYIRQIVYSLIRTKQVSKKVYRNLLKFRAILSIRRKARPLMHID